MTIAQPNKKRFIAEFEGLRGVLAAWVVFGHILLFSGFTYQDGWFGIVFSPVLGVYAFMMLSGFVITAALDQRPTGWCQFMSRRFFRLFPTYVLCMGLAILLLNMSIQLSHSTTLQVFGPENLDRLTDVNANFGTYLLVDATLLQCLLPRSFFEFAHESFLPPTWSLTIEWLFYMVAPFLVIGLKRKRFATIGSVAAILVVIYLFRSQLEAINRSFHMGNAFHFLTGIASYYIWKHLPERKNCWFSRIGFWLAILSGIALLSLPYKIWIATMAVILYPRLHCSSFIWLELPRRILLSKPFQFLGRTSYVTYLLHWIVIELVLFWWMQVVPDWNHRLVLATLCTLTVYPITYVASDMIHRYIEVPFVRIPKQISQANNSEMLPA